MSYFGRNPAMELAEKQAVAAEKNGNLMLAEQIRATNAMERQAAAAERSMIVAVAAFLLSAFATVVSVHTLWK